MPACWSSIVLTPIQSDCTSLHITGHTSTWIALANTVQPRFSRPHLSRPSIIRTCLRPEYTYTEGVADNFLGAWQQLSDELESSTNISWLKLTDHCTCMNTADNDNAI